jgi:hypothetical protein
VEIRFAASGAEETRVSLVVEVADVDLVSGRQERVPSDLVAASVLTDSIWRKLKEKVVLVN